MTDEIAPPPVPTQTPTNGATASPDPGAPATPLPVAPPPAKPKKYVAALSHPGEPPQELPNEFAEAVLELEKLLGMEIWLFVQDGIVDEHQMSHDIEQMFFENRHSLPQGKPIGLLIESPGGLAECAYGIAKLLQRRCGSFVAIVANWAKSAATLLSLGASEIILAEHGQLGPLDVQLFDPAREEESSALNETQALEQLHMAGLEALINTLYVLRARTSIKGTRKRFDALLPHAVKFVAESMRPLYEKVDVVQYTTRLRDLKVAEEYAVRLLSPHYSPYEAKKLAGDLVEQYPDHGFIIDFDEAKRIGLHVKEPTVEQSAQLDKILLHITKMNAFGKVVEV